MGKLKTIEQYEAAMQEVLDKSANARMMRVEFSLDDAFSILERHGMTLIDIRLADVLDDMPVGLEDLIEDDEDE